MSWLIFVGIANLETAELNIHSAEYLPVLLSHKGEPAGLTLRLQPERPTVPGGD